jgi:alpha-2-macroglobulin
MRALRVFGTGQRWASALVLLLVLFTRSEGAQSSPPGGVGEPLSEREVKALFDRLPALDAETGGVHVASREGTARPPRTGVEVQEPFPQREEVPRPAPPKTPALEVTRAQPEGAVLTAEQVTIAFNQPLVALTSHDETLRGGAPVRLRPQPPGSWRYLDSRTLVFTPEEGRLPMATRYELQAPAGLAAVSGARLAAARAFSFETPPPVVLSAWPPSGQTVDCEPIFHLRFNQRIEARRVLALLHLEEDGRRVPVRLATKSEGGSDEATGPDVFVRATRTLKEGAGLELVLDKGVPSAEGPLVSAAPFRVKARTYGPFTVEKSECGWGESCEPGAPFRFELSNPVDSAQDLEALVRIEPPLPELQVAAYGKQIVLQGNSRGRTSYKVTLDATLKDGYGQTLGRAEARRFAVGPSPPQLSAAQGSLVVLQPPARGAKAPRTFSVFTMNLRALRVRVHKAAPEEWARFKDAENSSDERFDVAALPGTLAFDEVVEVGGAEESLVETAIDLGRALEDGYGQAIVLIEAEAGLLFKLLRRDRRRPRLLAFVQATDMVIDTFADPAGLLAWVTRLEDGAPVAGAKVRLIGDGLVAVQTTSDSAGLARFTRSDAEQRLGVVAARGLDEAFLPAQAGWKSTFSLPSITSGPLVVSFSDRGLYRPGEEVRVKGFARRLADGPRGDLKLLAPRAALRYRALDARHTELAKGEVDLSPLGGFAFSFQVPSAANLGAGWLELEVPGESSSMEPFRIEEFRRPEAEAKLELDAGPHFVGQQLAATVEARYFAGGALRGAEVSWELRETSGSFTPPVAASTPSAPGGRGGTIATKTTTVSCPFRASPGPPTPRAATSSRFPSRPQTLPRRAR